MSFVTAVRDYVDFINQSYDSMSTHGSLLFLFQHTLLYLLESCKYGFFYLLSLRWLTDLSSLPTLVPSMSVAILRENFYPLESPPLNAFRLLESPSFLENKFFVGFLNSLFVSLPTSAIHLLAGRRLLVEGIPAGLAAGLGSIIGHSSFLAAILFGWRGVIFPWLSLEPFTYLVGLIVLLQMVYTICHAPSVKVVASWEKEKLLQFFLINLFLTWCEQSSIFQYVGNLTLTTDPSSVEHFFTTSSLSSFGGHALYVMGFFLGSCCFGLLFALLGLAMKDRWLSWSTMTTSRLINRLNFCFLVGVTALSLASIPYYGLDYLFTRGLGFVPQDKALEGTIFSPAGMVDRGRYLGASSNYNGLDTDVTPFDEGRYLKPSLRQTFEDVNYQGEQYWTARTDRRMFSAGGRKGKAFGRWATIFGGDGGKRKVQLVLEPRPPRKNESMKGVEGSSEGGSLPWYREFDELDVLDPSSDEKEGNSYQEEERDSVVFFSDPLLDEKEGKATKQAGKKSQPFTLKETKEKVEPKMNSPFETAENDVEEEERRKIEPEEVIFNDFFQGTKAGFSPLFFKDILPPTTLERYLKTKFYTNPIYHLLLRVDIDAFLSRQPLSHSLTIEEEIDLFRRRQILADYYASLDDFIELQGKERENDFDHFALGEADGVASPSPRITKNDSFPFGDGDRDADRGGDGNGNKEEDEEEAISYADRVYNHQFKGTLKVVRRLFSISLDPDQSSGSVAPTGGAEEARVLKFDQPLFHSMEGGQHPLVHEEVSAALRDDPSSTQGIDPSPFIEMAHSKPFYAGWDEQLRKLVITTRYLPRYLSTHGMRIPDEEVCREDVKEYLPLARRLSPPLAQLKHKETNGGSESPDNPILTSSRKILFTAWPLSSTKAKLASPHSTALASTDRFHLDLSLPDGDAKADATLEKLDGGKGRAFHITSRKKRKLLEGVDLFLHPNGEYHDWEIESWPENLASEAVERHVIPPTRGGFVWPGSSEFPFNVKKFIPDIKPFFRL